jgi:hypothetical protein
MKPNTWSAINGRKATPNYFPKWSHLNSQGDSPRGKRPALFRELVQYALDRGNISQMSETPSIDFLKACAANEDLRAELRITAAGYAARYEAHPKASKPYVPKIPPAYKLPSLKTVASCQEALIQIAHDVTAGTLAPDAGKYLREFVEPLLPSLEVSEVREQIDEFRAIVEQVEAAKTIELQPLDPDA